MYRRYHAINIKYSYQRAFIWLSLYFLLLFLLQFLFTRNLFSMVFSTKFIFIAIIVQKAQNRFDFSFHYVIWVNPCWAPFLIRLFQFVKGLFFRKDKIQIFQQKNFILQWLYDWSEAGCNKDEWILFLIEIQAETHNTHVINKSNLHQTRANDLFFFISRYILIVVYFAFETEYRCIVYEEETNL